jgi:hypothetical protein
MPHVTTNVNATTKVIYSVRNANGIIMDEIAISNKTAGNITITILKYNTVTKVDYTILSPTILPTGRTFYKTGGYLDNTWSLKVTISGGDADVDFNYSPIY